MEWKILAKFVVETPYKVLRDGCIVVEDDRVVDVGSKEISGKYPRYEKIDAMNCIVIPGLINSHCHAAMTLMRGVADDLPLDEWLGKIWPIERRLRRHDVYVGTMVACLEMVKSGTVCFNDMYFYADAAAEAIDEMGMRGIVAAPIIELGGEEVGEKLLRDSERLVRDLNGKADGRIRCSFGPHAPYTCSPHLLRKVKEMAERYHVTIHIHLAETRDEGEKVNEAYDVGIDGRTLVEYLDEINFLGKDVIAVHCIWLSRKDIDILARRGVGVASNPISNMKLADGIAPLPEMLHKGVDIGLGTDSAASNNSLDMFEEMKMVALVHKATRDDPTIVRSSQALAMSTTGGAHVLQMNDLGTIEKGRKADLVLVDLKRPHLVPLHDPISHLVYAVKGSDVKTVMIDGKLVVEDQSVLTVNENEILEEAQRVSESLLERAKE